jgi:hypothetical protein
MKPVGIVPAISIQPDSLDVTDRFRNIAPEPLPRLADSGARALMRAILRDAILCLKGCAAGVRREDRTRLAEQARCWICSRDITWIFSFESICHVLDIDPGFVRRLLFDGRSTSRSAVQLDDREVIRSLRTVRLRGNQSLRRLRMRRARPPKKRRP